MKALRKLNAIKSINNHEYFGEYRGIEWHLNGERDGNKVWWYLKDNEGENPMPAPNLKDAAESMLSNIDYFIDHKI